MMDTKLATMESIEKNDGSIGWYQLDRALTLLGILCPKLPTVIAELCDEGLLSFDGDPRLAATRYSITVKGREFIEKERINSQIKAK